MSFMVDEIQVKVVESFGDVPAVELEQRLLVLKAHLAAGECRLLLMLAELEERGTWRAGGYRSLAHWLSAKAGIDPGTAMARIRVATRLRGLPVVTAAFAGGALTYSQVRALCRALRDGADERRQGELVGLAQCMTAAQLEMACKVLAGQTDEEAGSAEEHQTLTATRHATFTRIVLEVPHVEAERFLAAAGCAEPNDHPAVNVVVALADYEAHRSGTLGDRPLAAAVIERLVCNGTVRGVVIDDDGRPVMAGSPLRQGTSPQRAAARARDGGRCQCCSSRWRVELHHVLLWAKTKVTLVDCLVSLCRACHTNHHRGRFNITIDEDTGRFHFWNPDGTPIHQPAPCAGSVDELITANHAAGVDIDPATIEGGWTGERLDCSALTPAPGPPPKDERPEALIPAHPPGRGGAPRLGFYDLDFPTDLTDADSNWAVAPYQPDEDGEDDMLTALASLGITTPQHLAALDTHDAQEPTTTDASRGTPRPGHTQPTSTSAEVPGDLMPPRADSTTRGPTSEPCLRGPGRPADQPACRQVPRHEHLPTRRLPRNGTLWVKRVLRDSRGRVGMSRRRGGGVASWWVRE